ncbi:hypothetical protein [Kitasatospora brasiliensis]|uniref:hypothetical protein n=1 Tax=Kitasatospora brasiliensis TaxID=3058040 RepID=UPI00292DE1B5|nr:hypothetical protein [Kitasatospora sp. K002]
MSTEQFERAFTEAIGRAGEAFDTEIGPLVDTGWSYGRRLRRRRRIATAAGAAALALVAVGGAAAGGALPGGRAPAPVGAAAPPKPARISGPELANMLVELLPTGSALVGDARGTESRAPQVRLLMDDDRGRAQILLWITRAPAGVRLDCFTGPSPADPSPRHAASRTGVSIFRQLPGVDPFAVWSAALTADGYQVVVQEWNGEPLAPGAPITRTDPPLTEDQLAGMAADPRWKQVAAALPDGPVVNVWPSFPPVSGMGPDSTTCVAPPVLPSGVPAPAEPAR